MKQKNHLKQGIIILPFILLFLILISGCKEKGLIKGKAGEKISNNEIELLVTASKMQMKSTDKKTGKVTYSYMTYTKLEIENKLQHDMEIKWIRVEYSDDKNVNVYNWLACKECNGIKVEAPIYNNELEGKDINYDNIAKKETELNYPSCVLKSNKKCSTSFVRLGVRKKDKIKIRVRLGDGSYTGPFVINIPDE